MDNIKIDKSLMRRLIYHCLMRGVTIGDVLVKVRLDPNSLYISQNDYLKIINHIGLKDLKKLKINAHTIYINMNQFIDKQLSSKAWYIAPQSQTLRLHLNDEYIVIKLESEEQLKVSYIPRYMEILPEHYKELFEGLYSISSEKILGKFHKVISKKLNGKEYLIYNPMKNIQFTDDLNTSLLKLFLEESELYNKYQYRIAPGIVPYFKTIKNNLYASQEFYAIKWYQFNKERGNKVLNKNIDDLYSIDIESILINMTKNNKITWSKLLDTKTYKEVNQKFKVDYIYIRHLCEYYSFELNITKYKKELKWISHYELKWQNKYDDVALCRTTNIKKLYDVVTSMAINEKKKNENSYINQKLFKCKIKEVPINSNDFLVRTNLFRCYYKEHLVEEIIGVVKIVTPKGDIREERVSCAYCPNCYCFYILNSQYDNLRKIGIILCQLIDKEDYYKFGKLNEFNVAKESLLMQNRYNVKANNGMTDIQRKIILKNIIDNKILSAHRISSYLDMFISQKKSMPQYSEAIQKWESDKRFVLEYKSNDKRIVNIDSIKII